MNVLGGYVLMTYEEAVANGIECLETPPEERERCGFCRKELPYKGFVKDGKIARFYALNCSCAEAAQIARIKEERENRSLILAGMAEQRKRLAAERDDGISARYRKRTFERFEERTKGQKTAKAYALRYADAFSRVKDMEKNSLFFYGGCGCGKTHLACAIANSLREKGVECLFTTFEDMLLRIRESYDRPDLSDKAVRDGYKTAALLIVDDLAKEKATDFSTSVLFDLINYRYENMLPMVITANHGRDDLVKRLTPKDGDATKAEAVVSRLYEMCVPVSMAGIEDQRRMK